MKQNKKSFLQKNVPLLAILFILGIIFLYLSEYDSNKKIESSIDFDTQSYTKDLENRLSTMLEQMDGVESVRVMITLETGSRYQISGIKGNTTDPAAYVNSFSHQDGYGNGEKPTVMAIEAPKIKGVSVVCAGAENIQIRERIINLIASTLNLTKNKIYVTE